MTTHDPLVAQTVGDLRLELDEDFVGIWQIFARLRRGRDDWTDESITAAAEEILRRLAASGAEFGNLAENTGYFIPWPDQAGAVQRASREWQAMDRDPTIDEIAWLDLNDPTRETRVPAEPSTATFDELVAETTQYMNGLMRRGPIDASLIFLYLWRVRHEADLAEIQEFASAVLAMLVSEGAVVGDYDSASKTVVGWPDQDSAVARAERGWQDLGRSPAPGEICWLVRRR